jgi:hypothetical protein
MKEKFDKYLEIAIKKSDWNFGSEKLNKLNTASERVEIIINKIPL